MQETSKNRLESSEDNMSSSNDPVGIEPRMPKSTDKMGSTRILQQKKQVIHLGRDDKQKKQVFSHYDDLTPRFKLRLDNKDTEFIIQSRV